MRLLRDFAGQIGLRRRSRGCSPNDSQISCSVDTCFLFSKFMKTAFMNRFETAHAREGKPIKTFEKLVFASEIVCYSEYTEIIVLKR